MYIRIESLINLFLCIKIFFKIFIFFTNIIYKIKFIKNINKFSAYLILFYSKMSKIYPKDSFDRFGDDLTEVLLSYISFKDSFSLQNVSQNSGSD